ncbi:MAG TPA: hypothetical protein VGI74_05430 [Streptosporangiaceae bacterium]|jgi:hypothetical protein
MLSWLVGALLAAWFLVTVVRNLPPLRAAFLRIDAGRLIPDWALFARPRTADMVLLRRDLLLDGTLTSWREVEVAGPRRWYNFIWNPDLGPRRGFLSLASIIGLVARRDQGGQRQIRGQGTRTALPGMTGVHYLTVLQYLSRRSHAAVDATQFMIMAVSNQSVTGRHAPDEPASSIEFVSEIHLVRPAQAGLAGR